MKLRQMGVMAAMVSALVISVAVPVIAQESGRYQAISVGSDKYPATFILDTKEGHLWLWRGKLYQEPYENASYSVMYQGQIRPGKKIGDTIERVMFPFSESEK